MSHPTRRTSPRARTALVLLPLFALVLGLLAGPATTAQAAPRAGADPQRQAAVADATAWLKRRVGTGNLVTAPARHVKVKVRGHHGKRARWVTRSRPGPAYPGVSIDVLLALRQLDPGGRTQLAMAKGLQRKAVQYVGYRMGALEGRYAEATARTVFVAASAGLPLHKYADGTLRRSLAKMMRKGKSDLQRGRLVDSGWAGDRSNTISQAWAVRALAALDSKHLPIAARFLAAQHCPAGHFRLLMDSPDYTCKGSMMVRNRVSSTDATALAVLALRQARAQGVRGLQDEISAASKWLSRRVKPSGGVAENGEVNARTTALTALALRATGRRGPAGTAAAWLLRHQVDGVMVKRHKALRGQRGAIALDNAALARAKREGIRKERKAWLETTAIAAPALKALLPPQRLTVRTRQGDKRMVVRISGLLPGERYVLKRAGRTVDVGRAKAKGVVRVIVAAPRKKVRLKAFGSRSSRAGVTVVSGR